MARDMFAGERVLAFDLETTGVSTRKDRIVQLALIGADKDGTPIHYEVMVNPKMPIPVGASRVHGIWDADVRGLGEFRTVADEVAALIDGAVIVGHNVRKFDLPILDMEFMRCGRSTPEPSAVLDTLELVRRLRIPPPRNLGALCARHGIDLENAHTAGADAAATLLLFWRLSIDHAPHFRRSLKELDEWGQHGEARKDTSSLGRGLVDLQTLDKEGRVRIDDGGKYILGFGRHKGQTVEQIEADDKPYIDWLLSPAGLKDDDAMQKIKSQLNRQ